VDSLARQIERARDGHEVLAVANEAVRGAQVRSVGEVERLHPELQLGALGERELAEKTEVPVEQSRCAQAVEADVPETSLRDLREGRRIVVGRAASDSAQL